MFGAGLLLGEVSRGAGVMWRAHVPPSPPLGTWSQENG